MAEEQATLAGIEEAPPVDEAEIHLAEAREFVHEALRCLNHIVVDVCPGSERIPKAQLQTVKEAHTKLIGLRDAL